MLELILPRFKCNFFTCEKKKLFYLFDFVVEKIDFEWIYFIKLILIKNELVMLICVFRVFKLMN